MAGFLTIHSFPNYPKFDSIGELFRKWTWTLKWTTLVWSVAALLSSSCNPQFFLSCTKPKLKAFFHHIANEIRDMHDYINCTPFIHVHVWGRHSSYYVMSHISQRVQALGQTMHYTGIWRRETKMDQTEAHDELYVGIAFGFHSKPCIAKTS